MNRTDIILVLSTILAIDSCGGTVVGTTASDGFATHDSGQHNEMIDSPNADARTGIDVVGECRTRMPCAPPRAICCPCWALRGRALQDVCYRQSELHGEDFNALCNNDCDFSNPR